MIKIFGIALILIFIFKSFISILINYIIINFTLNLELYLRSKLTNCYQNMPYKLFVTKNSSHVIYSILNLAGNFSGGVVQLILKMISDCVISLAIIVFLAVKNPKELSVLIMMILILVVFYDLFFKSNIKKYGENVNTSNTSMVKNVNETIKGFKEIRVLGLEKFFYEKIYDSAKELSDSYKKHQIISQSPRYFLELFLIFFLCYNCVYFI